MARASASDRLRDQRELFQRAVRENISMDEARRRNAAERWASVDARLAVKASQPCTAEDRQAGFWWDR